MKKYAITLLTATILLFIQTPTAYARNLSPAEQTAYELNELYKRTADCDNGSPSYYCSGLIIRATLFTYEEPWYPRRSTDAASFSFLRSDITPHVGFPIYWNGISGYILSPLNELKPSKRDNYNLLCYFPFDGMTNGSQTCQKNPCQSEGIVTVSQFASKYLSGSFEPGTSNTEQCSMSPDYDGIKLGMAVDKYAFRDHIDDVGCKSDQDHCVNYNEVLISSWRKETVNAVDVPIKAFFITVNDVEHYDPDNYFDSHFDKDGHWVSEKIDPIALTFKAADAYKQETGREIPVVALDMAKLKAGRTDIFSPAKRP